MPEEGTPETPDTPDVPEASESPEVEATPAPEPEEGSEQQTDYEKRYRDLQPEYTRATQEAAELRGQWEKLQSDPEYQREVFRALAEELEYELEEEDLAEEEDEYRDPRVDAIEQRLQEREYNEYLDNLETHVDTEIKKLAEAAQTELSDEETDLIFAALTPGEDGEPDIKAAFKKVTGIRDNAIKSYVSGKKRAPQAPAGASASHQPNLDDAEDRRAWIASQLQGSQQ